MFQSDRLGNTSPCSKLQGICEFKVSYPIRELITAPEDAIGKSGDMKALEKTAQRLKVNIMLQQSLKDENC